MAESTRAVHKLHPGPSLRESVDVRELHAALIDLVRTWVQTRAEVKRTPYGVIVRDERHPLVHEANMAWVERSPEGGVGEILGGLDDAFHGTGVRHRYVLYSDAQGAFEAQESFIGHGFQALAEVVMAKVGLPSCIVNPDLSIRETGSEAPQDDYRIVQETVQAESGYSREESDQVNEVERARGLAVGERVFVGYLDDEPVSTYTLWPHGTFALIGNVATLPRFRMRGVGRTMIFDACRRAIQARAEYALLTSNLFDTPQAMYKTLGFEPVGEIRGFLHRRP